MLELRCSRLGRITGTDLTEPTKATTLPAQPIPDIKGPMMDQFAFELCCEGNFFAAEATEKSVNDFRCKANNKGLYGHLTHCNYIDVPI